MTRIVISPQATADIEEIFDHLFEAAGIAVVDGYARDLQELQDRLAMFPASGALRPQLGRGTRIALLSPYLVIYDYSAGDETLTLARVLDGRRNITRRLVRG
jgi:toxin ParE1/3/4